VCDINRASRTYTTSFLCAAIRFEKAAQLSLACVFILLSCPNAAGYFHEFSLNALLEAQRNWIEEAACLTVFPNVIPCVSEVIPH